MSDESKKNNTAIITAIIALCGSIVATSFSAYSTIQGLNQKYSVERAKLFSDLIKELGSEEGKKSRLGLLNLWQLYPERHDIILMASIEVGDSDLTGTMIQLLGDSDSPAAKRLEKYMNSENEELAMVAQDVIEKINPEYAIKGYLGQLSALGIDDGLNDEVMASLIELYEKNPAVIKGLVNKQIKALNKTEELIMKYILYRTNNESNLINNIPNKIDTYADILCCGDFFKNDHTSLIKSLIQKVENDPDSNKYSIATVATFLNNESLYLSVNENNEETKNRIVKFSKKIFETSEYTDARLSAIAALLRWAPSEGLSVAANHLASIDRDKDDEVKFIMEAILNDDFLLEKAFEALELNLDDERNNIPKADSDPGKWKQWKERVFPKKL